MSIKMEKTELSFLEKQNPSSLSFIKKNGANIFLVFLIVQMFILGFFISSIWNSHELKNEVQNQELLSTQSFENFDLVHHLKPKLSHSLTLNGQKKIEVDMSQGVEAISFENVQEQFVLDFIYPGKKIKMNGEIYPSYQMVLRGNQVRIFSYQVSKEFIEIITDDTQKDELGTYHVPIKVSTNSMSPFLNQYNYQLQSISGHFKVLDSSSYDHKVHIPFNDFLEKTNHVIKFKKSEQIDITLEAPEDYQFFFNNQFVQKVYMTLNGNYRENSFYLFRRDDENKTIFVSEVQDFMRLFKDHEFLVNFVY